MKRPSGKFVALVVSLALVSPSILGQQDELRYKELPNFHKVSENVYRGGQPQGGGLKRLTTLGIRTVVDLRGAGERSRDEEAEANKLGLRYFSIEMPGLARPSIEKVERALAIISDPGNWPVFVHCKRGSDRTGTVIACFRISQEGWTAERAISEAKRYGMRWILFGMRDFISSFYRRVNHARPKQSAGTTTH